MPGPVSEVARELETRATEYVREHRLPGAAAAVVVGDELAWFHGAGFADVPARRPPEPGTLYRIASITKTFTGTAIMQLRDAGRLGLDDAAVDHLPELRDAASPLGPIESVTIRRLMSHESGLMNDPPGTDWDEPRYQGDPLVNLAAASAIGVLLPPNAQQKYSNIGYQLLGEIVARALRHPATRSTCSRTSCSRWGWRAPGFCRWRPSSSAAVPPAMARVVSATSWRRRSSRPTARPRAACSHALTTLPAGSASSCTRPAISATACCRPRRCGRCTGPAIWATTPGRRRSGSAGMRSAVARTCGCSTAAACMDSPPMSASTRSAGWVRSRSSTASRTRIRWPWTWPPSLATRSRPCRVRSSRRHRRRRPTGRCSACIPRSPTSWCCAWSGATVRSRSSMPAIRMAADAAAGRGRRLLRGRAGRA